MRNAIWSTCGEFVEFCLNGRTSKSGSWTTKGVGKGTGLGLTISRMLVELQGGTLTLESTEGRGTTSCFDLPLAAPDARRAD